MKYVAIALTVSSLLLGCGGGLTVSLGSVDDGYNNVLRSLPYQYTGDDSAKKYTLNPTYKMYTKSLTLGDTVINQGSTVDFKNIKLGYTKQKYAETQIKNNQQEKYEGHWKIYNMPYSVMAVGFREKLNSQKLAATEIFVDEFIGQNTAALPAQGTATYKGIAFDKSSVGDLELVVNFSTKKADGKITGLSLGTLSLNGGQIGVNPNDSLTGKPAAYVTGPTKVSGVDLRYYGYFYGPNAEEVIGDIKDNNRDRADLVGFAGQRGNIK